MPRGAPLLVRRDRVDVADVAERRGEPLDPLREDSVVVGDEDPRADHAAGSSGITIHMMMYTRIPGNAADRIETST